MKNSGIVLHNKCIKEQTKCKHTQKNMYNLIHFYKLLMK